MAEMFILKPAAQAINDGMYAVREAANNKGANITPDTPLISNDPAVEDWADKIGNIPSAFPIETVPEVGSNVPAGFNVGDPFIIPTGEGVSSTFDVDSSFREAITRVAKKVIIPEYFSTIGSNNTNLGSTVSNGVLEELETNAVTLTNPSWFLCSAKMKKLTINKTVEVLGSTYRLICGYHNTEKLTISMPDATHWLYGGASGTTIRELEFNVPKLEYIQGPNVSGRQGFFQYGYGVFKFPKVTKIGLTGMKDFEGTDASKVQDWRFPSLADLSGINTSYGYICGATTVKNKVRIGPNLAASSGTTYILNKWKTEVQNNRMEIHVPNDTSSTTYITFLANSADWGNLLILDYDYQADM